MIRYVLAIAFLAFSIGNALADAPLPPRKTKVVCSASEKFCVTSDLEAQSTFLWEKSTGKRLWSVPGWHRWVFVSDDGQSIAIGYNGMNLLARNVTLSEPIIYLYNDGQLVRTVILGEFFKSISELRPTVSHYAWGSILGFNRANQLVVTLVSGTDVAFSALSGEREEVRPD
jgi:hypothetical protein